MAKKKEKSYMKAELIEMFELTRLVKMQTTRMQDWLANAYNTSLKTNKTHTNHIP